MNRLSAIKNARSGALLVLGVLVCALAACLIAGCSSNSGYNAKSGQTLYQYNHDRNAMALNDYDYTNLEENNGLKYYVQNGKIASKVGVDISDYQDSVNWSKLKAAGVDFVILRAGYRGSTEGGLYADDSLAEEIRGAHSAGLGVGIYFFSQAKNETEAREEATFTLDLIAGQTIDYPVVYDIEPTTVSNSRIKNITSDQATANTIAFCDTVANAGYSPMVYMNRTDATTLLDLAKLQDYSFWYAEYASTPSLDFKFAIWQYTNEGSLYGIDGNVDLNIYFTETDL